MKLFRRRKSRQPTRVYTAEQRRIDDALTLINDALAQQSVLFTTNRNTDLIDLCLQLHGVLGAPGFRTPARGGVRTPWPVN